MQIIPAILEKNFVDAEKKVLLVEKLTKLIQIDVTDGFFTPGKSFELELLNKINLQKVMLWDIHLMVNEPIKWLEKCLFVGASRVCGQVEKMSDREEFIKTAKDMGMEAGLAFDIDTELGEIPIETDFILLMSRKLGFEKSEFDKKVFEKTKDLNIPFCIDGGVNNNNLKEIKEKGFAVAYCGEAVFDGNVEENYNKLIENAS